MTNTRTIKDRAKQIFAETYGYPRLPFKSIGRKCFAAALANARAEAKAAAQLAAIPANVRAARVASLSRELSLIAYRADYRAAQIRKTEIHAELARLAA